MSKAPRLVLGTMTFSGQTNREVTLAQMDHYFKTVSAKGEVPELDTARMYMKGETEKMIGDVLTSNPSLKYTIASKVNCFKGYNNSLSRESVESQMGEILSSLKRDDVDILYLHAPDVNVTIEETLATVQDLYIAGKFKRLGLSNYSAWEVAYISSYMEKHGWIKPSVYQGMYNPVTRQISAELIPCLHKLDIDLYIYNPLAGGLLSGKYSLHEEVKEGRFANNQMYKDRFWTESHFHACDIIREACTKNGDIKMSDASLRWLMHHSELRGGRDAIILGASTLGHLENNLEACYGEALPKEVVDAFDNAWNHIRNNNAVPSYFRGHSKLV